MQGCLSLISLLGLLFVGVGASQLSADPPPNPVITALTCHQGVDSGYRPYVQFAWQTQGAAAVRVESGYIDELGVFLPGGWHMRDKHPPQGNGHFLMKIHNYAVRVCISEPITVPEAGCAVCVPDQD